MALTPAPRSALMLLTARFTTEVSIWAKSTPSDAAVSTRRERDFSAEQLSQVESRVMTTSFTCGQDRDLGGPPAPTHPKCPPDSSKAREIARVGAIDEANVFNPKHHRC